MKTEELIKESVKQAVEGEASAKQVAGKLGEIVTGIGKVTDIVAEISAAAKEQSSGIDQVNQAVAEMDKVTQQNAASAEESSSAASELNGQAEELAAMVGAFNLGKASAPAARQQVVGHRQAGAQGHRLAQQGVGRGGQRHQQRAAQAEQGAQARQERPRRRQGHGAREPVPDGRGDPAQGLLASIPGGG